MSTAAAASHHRRYPFRWRGQNGVAGPAVATWVREGEAFLPNLLKRKAQAVTGGAQTYRCAATGKWHREYYM